MKTLNISTSCQLPADIALHKNAVLAMSGAGKSNAAVVLAEEMHAAGIPWVAVDPKGDWYGVRSMADGSPGLAVPVFGGLHGDIPLDPKAGTVMAGIIASKRLTCVLDVSEFDSKAAQMRFLTDFATALLRHNREPLHVFCEEADEYCPQHVLGEAAKCVSAWQKLVKRGRFRGIGVTLISQRSAALNKDALNQTDNLFAMRVTAPRDRKAIEEWVKDHTASPEMLKSLPNLGNGEAWLYSPQKLELMERLQFRRRKTLDTGETPGLGEKTRRPVASMAEVDLAGLRDLLVAEPASKPESREDRKEITDLRLENTKLRRELAMLVTFLQRNRTQAHEQRENQRQKA